MGRNLISAICSLDQMCTEQMYRGDYRPDVFLKELWPYNCSLDIVYYFCLARKAAQGGRQSPLHMFQVVWAKIHVQLTELDVFQRTRVLLTVVVERELRVNQPPSCRTGRTRGPTLNLNG